MGRRVLDLFKTIEAPMSLPLSTEQTVLSDSSCRLS